MSRELPDTIAEDDRFLNTEQAARYLNLKPATLITWRSRKEDGPPFFRLAQNKVSYLRSELLAWMEQHRVTKPLTIAERKPTDPPRPWE